jgi:hypothetical protein
MRQIKSIVLLPSPAKSKLTAWIAIGVATVIALAALHSANVFGAAWDYLSSGKRRELPVARPSR